MYVISVKGIANKTTTFFYVKEDDEKKLVLTGSFADGLQFVTEEEATAWAKERYADILGLLLFHREHKIFNTTIAIRKINFKTIKMIDQNIINEEVPEDASEANNVCDENSDNDNIGDSELEEQSTEYAEEASESNL